MNLPSYRDVLDRHPVEPWLNIFRYDKQCRWALVAIIWSKKQRIKLLNEAIRKKESKESIMKRRIDWNLIDCSKLPTTHQWIEKSPGFLSTRLNKTIKWIDTVYWLDFVKSPVKHHTIWRLHDVDRYLEKIRVHNPEKRILSTTSHISYQLWQIMENGLLPDNTLTFDKRAIPEGYDIDVLNALWAHKYINRIARAYETDYIRYCNELSVLPVPLKTYMLGVAELYDIERANLEIEGDKISHEPRSRYAAYATPSKMKHLAAFFVDHVERKKRAPMTEQLTFFTY